jgi:phospholipase/lecithinase/hemolysin
MVRRIWLFLLFASLVTLAHAQHPLAFSRVFIFGDSLSDTGNVYSATSYSCQNDLSDPTCYPYPGPQSGYDAGIFTDGLSSQPGAELYFNLWHQQLTVLLQGVGGINIIRPGANYAWGSATTQKGTSTVAEGPFNVTIENMGQQVNDYLNSGQSADSSTLYVLFGGLNDLLNTPSVASANTAAQSITSLVQQLAAAGATNFLVPNQPPLTAYSNAQYGPAVMAFRTALASDLLALQAQLALNGKPIKITQVDLYSLFTAIAASPSTYGFTNVTAPAQKLSPNGVGSYPDPDSYLSWDGINPTTAGHYQIAHAACTALTQTTTTVTASAATATTINPATITATVSNTGTYGTPVSTIQPTGSITFYNGTTAIGAAPLQNGKATFSSTSLGSANYTITAVYSGDTNFPSGCVSNTVALSVSLGYPGYTIQFPANPIYIGLDQLPVTTVSAKPMDGFTGSVTFSCGALPQNFLCQWTNPTVQVLNDGSTSYAQLIIQTGYSVSKAQPLTSPGRAPRTMLIYAGLLVLPLAWMMRRRRSLVHLVLLGAIFSAFASLTACAKGSGSAGNGGGGATKTPPTVTYNTPGTYYIPIIGTSNGVQTTMTLEVSISDGL